MLFSPAPKRKRLQLRISERRLLLMAGDAVAIVVAVMIALYIWAGVADKAFTAEFVFPQSYWFFVLLILWLMLASANDFYELPVAANRAMWIQKLAVITAQLIVIYFTVFFLSPREALPRLFIVYYGLSSFLLIAAWRFVNPALVGWASEKRLVLIIGADAAAETIIHTLQEHGHAAYTIRGIMGNPEDVGREIADVPVVGTGNDLLNFVLRDRISELIFTSAPDMTGDTFRGVMEAYERGVVLTPMPIMYERLTGRVPVQHVNSNWAMVLPISGNSIFDPYPVIRWLINALLGIAGFVVFIAVLVPVALLIRMDSSGGIFYMQRRVGLNGRDFEIIKFRTMVKDAEAKTGAVFSRQGDTRVTRVGRFLRKTRLDELPQVINILRGDMNLVGPRPERPEHITRLTQKIPFYRTRLVIRPGLTGWAQVRYPYGSDDHDALVKLEYDLYYIRHQSLWLDLNILIRTIGRVLRMSGV